MSNITFKELAIDIAKAYFNKLFYPRFPLGITLYLTEACNLRCSFCEIGQRNSLQPSTTNSIDLSKKDIDEILQLCRNVGVSKLYITGGEPFLSDTIWYLLERCNENHIIVSDITTNGTLLQEFGEWEIKRINNCVRNIVVSIDYANEIEHDSNRGVDGTFKKIDSFFNNFEKRNQYRCIFSFNVVVHSKNMKKLKEIIDLALTWHITHINFQPLSPHIIIPGQSTQYNKSEYVDNIDLTILKKEINKLMTYCIEKNMSTNLKLFYLWVPYYFSYLNSENLFFNQIPIKLVCSKIFNYIHLNYNGDLLACVNLRPFVNIHDNNYFHKWQEHASQLKKLFAHKKYSDECRYCYCDFPINFRLSLVYSPIANIRFLLRYAGYYLKRITIK